MSALADPPEATSWKLRPRRIALFTGAYNHIADGVSLTLNRLVAHLERAGTEVRVFAPTVDDPPVDHKGTLVPVPSVAAPGRSEYRVTTHLPRRIRRQIEDFAPSLFHLATPDLVGRQALKLAESLGTPAVASYHTHFSSYLKYYRLNVLEGVLWAYLRRFYRRCRHVYVPSPSMAEVLRSHGIARGLRLWERGVDTRRFHPNHRSLALRRTHGIADDEVVVAFIGRLVWEKGLDVYADVIEALQANGTPHRSLIVGDGPARAELEERLPETIFAGHLEDDALPRAYASSDVFLFPSDTETFGNVTLEAMASGLPTVCADATGSRSLVKDGKTGFLAPAGNTERFLHGVQRLACEPELRRKMGRRALYRAQKFEWETVMNRLVGYYDEILDPTTGGDGATSDVAPLLATAA